METKLVASGFWNLINEETEYVGDLYIGKEKGNILLYLRVPAKGGIGSYFKFPNNIEFIKGHTNYGATITLVDLYRVSTKTYLGSEDIYGYRANFLLQGCAFDTYEDITFSSMTLHIPGIIKWGNISNFNLPQEGSQNAILDYKPLNELCIYKNEEYELSYFVGASYPFVDYLQEEITLKQYPNIIIKSNDLKPIEYFIDRATKFKKLIEISIGSPLHFDKISAESPNELYDCGEGEKILKPIEIVHSLKNHEILSNTDSIPIYKYLFDLTDLTKNGDIELWEKNYIQLEPILELYLDDLYNPISSISHRFLNIVQALETYHSRFICNGPISKYKNRVEQLIKGRPEESKIRDREFLMGRKPKSVYLSSRIADLLLAEFQFIFYTGDFDYIEFPKIIAKTRNYYTHYNPIIEHDALKDKDLYHSYLILKVILEYYLLKSIGFKMDFIEQKIRSRIQPIVNSIDIGKIDKKKFNVNY